MSEEGAQSGLSGARPLGVTFLNVPFRKMPGVDQRAAYGSVALCRHAFEFQRLCAANAAFLESAFRSVCVDRLRASCLREIDPLNSGKKTADLDTAPVLVLVFL